MSHICIWVCFWTLFCLIDLCVYPFEDTTFLGMAVLQKVLKIKHCESYISILLFKIRFSYSSSFAFLSKFKNQFISIYKVSSWILIRIALKLWINSWRIYYIILSFSTHEHNMSLYLFRSFLISFIGILQFQYLDPACGLLDILIYLKNFGAIVSIFKNNFQSFSYKIQMFIGILRVDLDPRTQLNLLFLEGCVLLLLLQF